MTEPEPLSAESSCWGLLTTAEASFLLARAKVTHVAVLLLLQGQNLGLKLEAEVF